jgi:hypothetical protein
MDAKELRKKLNEGLKPDSSGKSTPIQRLTPFLTALVDYIDEHDSDAQIEKLIDRMREREERHTQVSSDDATRAATAQTNSESDGASKSSA